MNVVDGKLVGIEWETSPNERVGGNIPKYLILHAMCGSEAGTESWFENPKSQVSAHFLVGKTGKIIQMVKTTDQAWHCFGYNHCSIGIEHEDNGQCNANPHWVTAELLDASTNIATAICKTYNIPVSHILEHRDPMIQAYAKQHNPSMVHQDCGQYWDVVKYRSMVSQKLEQLNG